MVSFPFS